MKMFLSVVMGLVVCVFLNVHAQAELVGYWSFDDVNGKIVKDSSGSGNDGTIYGKTETAGKIGQALSFDGINNKVTFNKITLSTGTYSFWIKPNSLIGEQNIICSSDGLRRIQLAKNCVRIETDTNNQYFIFSSARLPLNKWTHITISRDGDYASIYKNGDFVQTVHMAGANSLTVNNFGGIRDGYRKFSGLLDEVRIYNTALTGKEIKQSYTSIKSSMTPLL